VKIGKLRHSAAGRGRVNVVVTNHSHQRSDYYIDLTVDTATGRTQLDDASVLVQGLEPARPSTTGRFWLLTLHQATTAVVQTSRPSERTKSY
jgi:hypothetical protein